MRCRTELTLLRAMRSGASIMERKIDEGDKRLLDHYAADFNLRKDEAVRFVDDNMEFENALSEFEPEERKWITMAKIRLSGLNRVSKVGRRLSWWSDRAEFLFAPQFEIRKSAETHATS
jgi:hypothetical protein